MTRREGRQRASKDRRRLAVRRALLTTLIAGAALAGCDARIGEPKLLWTLWLLPALAVFYLLSFRARAARLRRFAAPAMLERLTAGAGPRRGITKATLVTIAVAALLLALARLQVGYTWEEVERRGVDVVIALDVSNSMLVEDAGRTLPRLERAKREIHDLLQMMAGDRVGIVAFAGTAFVQCPMTLDYGAAQLFLEALDSDSIPVQGTDLAQALETSLAAFRGGGAAGSRAVLLITDGEDHSGRAASVAESLAAEGVRVFAIGIGSEEGAPIPASGGGFRRDRGGSIILSRLDETTLQQIALATDGRYVRSVTGDLDLEQIYVGGIKATLEEREFDAHRRQRWEDRFQWLLGLAIAALMIDGLLPEAAGSRSPRVRARSRSGGAAPRAAAAAALALLMLSASTQRLSAQARSDGAADGDSKAPQAKPAPAAAKRYDKPEEAYEAGDYAQALDGFVDLQVERPDDAAVTMNVGSSHFRLGDLEAAARSFQSAGATGDDRLRAQSWYDLGNVAYQQRRFEDAIEAYNKSLDLDPDDEDAKFNLEVASAALEQQQQQQQQQQQKDENQQQQQKDDQEKGDRDSEQQNDQKDQKSDSSQREQDEKEQSGQDQQQPEPRPRDQQQGDEKQGEAGEPREGEQSQLSPAEAQRLLDSLEEGRPRRRVPPGQKRDQEKDW